MERCPECWSTIEPTGPNCPQCGAPLGSKKNPSRAVAVAVGISLIAALGIGWSLSGDNADTRTPSDAADSHAATEVPLPAPHTESTTREVLHHWELRREVDDMRVDALVVASPDPELAMLFVPLSSIPRTGTLLRVDAHLNVTVAHVDPIYGYALLISERPEGIEPVELASSAGVPVGSVLEPVTRHGEHLDPVRLAARSPDGTIVVDPEVERGCALLDAEGRAIGLMVDNLRALPVDQAMLWLNQRVGRSLAEVQAELRSDDPKWLLTEIDAILNADTPTIAQLTEVLGRADRAASLATDRATIEAAHDRLRSALRAKLRAEAQSNATTAIQTARGALARFPDDHGITGDLIQLLSTHGDAFEAAGLYERLRAVAPKEAEPGGRLLADALLRASQRLSLASKTAESRRALLRGLGLFPRHEGLKRALEANQRLEYVIPLGRSGSIDTNADVGGIIVSFVVDTGATLTPIPTSVANRLGIRSPNNPTITVQTASGAARGERVRLPYIQLGQIRLQNVDAVVIDLPGTLHNRGLLGMSALGQLDITMGNGKMTLRPKSGN